MKVVTSILSILVALQFAASASASNFDEWMGQAKSNAKAAGEKVVFMQSCYADEANTVVESFRAKKNRDYTLMVVADADETQMLTVYALDDSGETLQAIPSNKEGGHPTVKYRFSGLGKELQFEAIASKGQLHDAIKPARVYFVVVER